MLVPEYIYKSDPVRPGTRKMYYGPETTFGEKSATIVKNRGVICCRKCLNTTGSLVAPFNFCSIFFQSIFVSLRL